MKILFFIFLTLPAYSQETCLSDIQPFDASADPSSKLSGTPCSGGVSSVELKSKMQKKVSASENCKKCNDPFGDLVRQTDTGTLEKKRRFLGFAMDEMKKSMSAVAMDLMKIRSSHNLDLSNDLPGACDFSGLPQGKCKAIISEKSIKLFQAELANEIYNILSPNKAKTPALFERFPSSCDVSDADAAKVMSKYSESQFDETTVRWLKEQYLTKPDFDLTKVTSVPNGVALPTDLLYNPIIKSILNNKQRAANFFNSIATNDTQTDILSKLNTSAKSNLSEDIRERCSTAKKTIESICESPSFNKGDVFADESSYVFDGHNDHEESTRENELRQFCFELNSETKETLKLSTLNKQFNLGTELKYKKIPYSNYKSSYYTDNLDTYRTILCSKENTNCKDQTGPHCTLKKIWQVVKEEKEKAIKENKTPFADQSVNRVLFAMIGNSTGLDPEVRKVLVAERIIQDGTVPEPKKDPAYDPTPANIARDPVYKAANPNFKSTFAGGSNVAPKAPDQRAVAESTYVAPPTIQTQNDSQNVTTNDQDRTVAGQQTVQQALKDPFNQGLLDRLMKGRKQPTFTKAEVDKIVRERLASQNAAFANLPQVSQQTQIDGATDKFYDDAFNSSFGAAAANFKNTGRTNITRDKLSNYDRALAESLRTKYAADEAAGKPSEKSSTLGQKSEVSVQAGAVYELDVKLSEKIKNKEGQNFILTIVIGGQTYEFEVKDLVATPVRGKPSDPAVVKKVNDFFAKIPRERQQKLRFLNAILSANNT